MSEPNYKLRNDHVATVKHLRDERTRNDNTYATKTSVDGIMSDTIVSTSNGTSYLIAAST
jgi:hypothetical protein